MAAGKSAAVEAYERAEDEMRRQQARVAEARKAAAREFGDAVLTTGAGKLPTAQLKTILSAVVAMGADQALVALGVSSLPRAGSNGRGSAEKAAGGHPPADADGKRDEGQAGAAV